MKVTLQGVKETALIPLWARACETEKGASRLFDDSVSVEMMAKLDYDFGKFAKAKWSQIGTAVRTHILDKDIQEFLRRHPDPVCINLAGGLDTRYYRLDTGRADWYNLDLPDVTALRRALLPEEPERVHNISRSILDPSWVSLIEAAGRPVLLIMEGAAMYFSADEMKTLFAILAEGFPGASMLIEVMPPFIVSQQKHHDSVSEETAPFKWGVKDGSELEAMNPAILYKEQRTLYEGYRKYWGIMGILSYIPWWNRNCNDKIVKIAFQQR